MAARNVKAGQAFDPAEKMQSNTLKRHPKMDLNKNDLLRLLSYLEGELQARDVVIATLKAEKAKQLLYQAKYGRFGLGDPFMALQRDSDNMKDNSFDETAIKSMYDNQLAQLENLIATQRKAQLKMREQLAAAEKRYHKVCAELEDEKRKHAQDTAQGDDVTYMLEKERERLKQEVDFEKSQNRRFEKDLKKTLASLEEERANSAKHKQVALMLIRERKKLVERILEEKQKCAVLEHLMNDEKNKMLNMAEGLVQESKKSLRMEAAMEKQLSDFDAEREQLKSRAIQEEGRNKDLVSQVDSLKQQLEQLQKELQQQRTISRDSIQSIEIKSTASSKQGSREQSVDRSATPLPSPIAVTVPKLPQYMPPGSIILETSDRIPTGTMLENKRPVTTQLGNSPVVSPEKYIVSPGEITVQPDIRVMSSTALVEGAAGPRISLSAGGTTVLSTPGGKISFHVGQPGISRKASSVGRGTPPPIPPNKPILVASPSAKPAIPPKVGVTVTKDRVTLSGSEADLATRSPAKSMQIPVSVVANQSNVTSSRTSPREGSPMRKTTQLLASQLVNTADDTNLSSPSTLDFLGPEIADLQQVLVALATGESDSPVAIDSPSLTTTSSSLSQTHKYAACSNLEEMNQLLSERKSSVNLLTKDSSLLVSTAETGQEKNLKFLLDLGADPNISTATTSALHAAARAGHCGCILLLLDYGACVNQPDHSGWTPLHWAAAHGHIDCCQLLLDSGAKLDTQNKMNWTVLHAAAQNGHAQCLELFVDGTATGDVQPVCGAQAETPPPDHLNLVHKQDDDGCTPCHLAAMRDSKDCLEVLLKMNVDLDVTDGLGRTVHDVASRACKHLLDKYVETQQKLCTVVIDFEESNEESKGAQQYVIGSLKVSPDTSWSFFTECICSTLLSYYKSLDNGLKTKKITRLDPDLSPGRTPFTLGISMDSIKCFRLGMYEWTPGQSLDTKPFTLISNSDVNLVSVVIKGVKKCSVSLAFSLLLPVPAVQSYLRLLEQYKNVVFYGPDHTQKKNLVCHLANSLAEKELNEGRQPRMVHVKLHHKFSNSDFITVLKEKGCMVPVKTENTDKTAPILILENLELVRIPEVMQNLLSAIEHRGQTYTFKLKGDNGVFTTYFLVEKLYILGTMNKTRSSGLDVSFQHRFRWVQFRIDMEPIRGLLSRHLLRKLLNSHQGQLPPSDNSVFKAVEWVICVWQRLNDGLGKLGLPEIVFGPTIFFNCPVENDQPEAIFWWLTKVWNQYISPVVHGVITSQHTGKETAAANSQHKVANTALYVLMQRAVVSGCPLTGKEKTAYLSEFNGSSKLDTPVKIDRSPTGSLPHSSGYITRLSSQTKKEPSKSLEVNCVSNLSSKRSLSESSVLKKYWEPVRSESELSESMPKVRKLEFRSPFLRSFGCANPCSKFFGTSRTSSVSGPDFLKVKNSLSPCGDNRSSKSQSTENLHSGRTLSSSPFSFSLTTSTPPLNSFKFFEGTAESGLRESTGRSDKQCMPTELESRSVDTSHPDREVKSVLLPKSKSPVLHSSRV